MAPQTDGWVLSAEVLEEAQTSKGPGPSLLGWLQEWAGEIFGTRPAAVVEPDEVPAFALRQAASFHPLSPRANDASPPPRVNSAFPSPQIPNGRRFRIKNNNDLVKLCADVATGEAGAAGLEQVADIARQPQGGNVVANALESLSTTHLVGFFAQGTPRVARILAAILEHMAATASERTMALLLTATELPGGADAIAGMFQNFSMDSRASSSVATFFDSITQTPDGSWGMMQLMDLCDGVGLALAEGVRGSGDARMVGRGLLRLLDVDGGPACFTRLLHRLSVSRSGRESALELLLGLSWDVGQAARLLTRASSSLAGARKIVETLYRLAESERGQKVIGLLLERMRGKRGTPGFFNAMQHNAPDAFARLTQRLSGLSPAC